MTGAKNQKLIDSRAPVLAELEARSEAAISEILRTSLDGTLKDLKKAYNRFTSSAEPTTTGPDGGPSRRPGEYAVRENATRMLSLMDAAKGFLTPKELSGWSDRYKVDLAEAQQMGGELGGRLAELAKPGKVLSGTNKPAIEAAARTASAYIEAESAKFRDQIAQITGEGVARGWGSRKIEGAVRRALAGEDSTSQGLTNRMGLERRAQLVARSEIANAYVTGQLDNAKRNGYEFIRWIAAESERTCATCASRHGLIFKLSDVVIPAHPMCVLPKTLVATGLTAAAFRSTYRGDVVSVGLGDGQRFTVTANHPMLTTRGIVKAANLRQGDQLIKERTVDAARLASAGPDLDQRPVAAEDVFAAFAGASGMTPCRVPAASHDLHGDGAHVEGDVHVVRANRLLQYGFTAEQREGVEQCQHVGVGPVFQPFAGVGDLDAVRLAVNGASRGFVGWRDHGLALLRGGLSPAEQHGLAATAWHDPQLSETPPDDGSTDAQLLSDALDALSGEVSIVDVVEINVDRYHGPVYSFETMAGVYSVGVGILTGNCRCSASPVATTDLGISDPAERAAALDEDFWAQSREDVAKEFAASKGKTIDEVRGTLDKALRAPSASETRRRPDLSDSLPPVAVPGAEPVLTGLSKRAVTKAVKDLRGTEGGTITKDLASPDGKPTQQVQKAAAPGPVVRTAAQEADRAARREALRKAMADVKVDGTKASQANYDMIGKMLTRVQKDVAYYRRTVDELATASPVDKTKLEAARGMLQGAEIERKGLRGAQMMQAFQEKQYADELFSDPNVVKTRYSKIPNSGKGLTKADAQDIFNQSDMVRSELGDVYNKLGHDVTQPQVVRSLATLRKEPGLLKDASGENLILYRGVTEQEQIEQFMGAGPDGSHYAGRGMYGDGTYAAAADMTAAKTNENMATQTAETYSETNNEKLSHRYVAAMGVRADAKIYYGHDYGEDRPGSRLLKDVQSTIRAEAKKKLGVAFSNDGAAAAAMGYDGYAIHIGNDLMYFVILNRGALVVAASSKF